jgi:hypothetical protein
VAATATSADGQPRRPSALWARLFRRWDEVRERRSASGCLIGLQSVVRSLRIIVRLTLRVNASVPLRLGFIGAQ